MRKILFSSIVVVMAICFAACGSSKTKDKKAEVEVKTDSEKGLFSYDLYTQFEEDSKYTECPDWEGKTVGELEEEGYWYMGYAGVNESYYFTFGDDDYDYSVILDDSAADIMKNKKSGQDSDEIVEMLKDCTVEKCYSVETDRNDMDSSKYTIDYPEFAGKTIGELAEEGYMISTYMSFEQNYKFFIKGEDEGKYVVTLDDTFSDDIREELSFMLSDEERQELLKDCRIKTCFKK